ncbi:hypothetical protein J6590_102712 [Homalodisca vitripennis]|nr:hypothetical protein J6590_102712 [Homalodisca vitripennis]
MYKAETTIELGNTRQQAAAPAYLQAGVESQLAHTIDNNIPPPSTVSSYCTSCSEYCVKKGQYCYRHDLGTVATEAKISQCGSTEGYSWRVPGVYVWEPTSESEMTSHTKMLISANPTARDCNTGSWGVPRVYVWEVTSASKMMSRTRMLIAPNPAARDCNTDSW